MLKSKIHGATLTGTELDYQGSITVDQRLLDQADILPGEQVHVLNINNGTRCITYTISGEKDTGIVLLNGPAARLGQTGDKVIILSYCQVPADMARDLRPTVIFVDERNRVKEGVSHGANLQSHRS